MKLLLNKKKIQFLILFKAKKHIYFYNIYIELFICFFLLYTNLNFINYK